MRHERVIAGELQGVTKEYSTGTGKTVSLRDISLQAFAGELLVTLGPSGSGKTTLLTILAGLLRPTSGSVKLFGSPIASLTAAELQHLRACRIGFVFQTFNLLDALSVTENVAVVGRFGGMGRAASRDRAWRLLRFLEIEHLAHEFPPTLSQGEKQRVAVARAFVNQADLIIADEPTACLETEQGRHIIRLLQAYAHSEGKCVVVATHDLRIVDQADRVMRLEDGAEQSHARPRGTRLPGAPDP